METLTYDEEITAVLVIDPYNDFISGGGKEASPGTPRRGNASACLRWLTAQMTRAKQFREDLCYPSIFIVPSISTRAETERSIPLRTQVFQIAAPGLA